MAAGPPSTDIIRVTPTPLTSAAVGAVDGAVSGALVAAAIGVGVVELGGYGDVLGAAVYSLLSVGIVIVPAVIVVQALLGLATPRLLLPHATTERDYATAMALVSLITGTSCALFTGPAGAVLGPAAALTGAVPAWFLARAFA